MVGFSGWFWTTNAALDVGAGHQRRTRRGARQSPDGSGNGTITACR